MDINRIIIQTFKSQNTRHQPLGKKLRYYLSDMKKLIGLFIILIAINNLAFAGDWPRWRGVKYDGKSQERGLLQEWPKEGPAQVWIKDDIGLGYSGPTISNGNIFIMGTNLGLTRGFSPDGKSSLPTVKELLFSKKVSNGENEWQIEIGEVFNNHWGHGPRGSVTVDGEHVYALGTNGNLICANAKTGKVIWKRNLVIDYSGAVPKWGYTESPLIYKDLLICTPGGNDGTLAALDKNSGELKWRSTGWQDAAQYSSCIPAKINNKNQIVQLTQKSFAGVSADTGELLWRSIWPGRVAVIPTPIVKGNQVYISSGYGVGCRKVSIENGDVVVDYSNKNMKNHHGGVLLLDDNHLYGYSDQIGWVCQDFDTGEIVWESKELGKGSVFYADNRLYCVQEKTGMVVLLDASNEGYKEHGKFALKPKSEQRQKAGGIWTHPVISDGKLYLRDQEKLFSFDIRKNN